MGAGPVALEIRVSTSHVSLCLKKEGRKGKCPISKDFVTCRHGSLESAVGSREWSSESRVSTESRERRESRDSRESRESRESRQDKTK